MITQEKLKELFRYEPDTGKFFHRKKRSGVSDITKEAGTLSSGYIRIRIGKKSYRAHRLAWLYYYGVEPDGKIDHINHNRADNRISNLRVTDDVGNSRNLSKMCTNTSGVTGVCWHKRKNGFEVRISDNGKNKYIGTYSDFDEACAKREEAEIKYGYHPNHGI